MLSDTDINRPREDMDRPWCTHASFIEDGSVAMDEGQLVQFTSRLSLAFMIYMLRQHSQHLDLRIDCDQVLEAITFMHQGQRVSLAPWSDCPGWRPKECESPVEDFPKYQGKELIEQDGIRVAAWKRWMDYAKKTAQHIPRAVTKRQVAPQVKPKRKCNDHEELADYYNDHCEQINTCGSFSLTYSMPRDCRGEGLN